MGVIKSFIEYTFIRRFEDVPIVIDEVPEPSTGGTAVKRKKEKPDPERRARIDIVIFCNKIIGIVLLLSLCFMFVYSFAIPNKAIPEPISKIAWACLGYFGSTVTVFIGRRTSKS